MNEYLESNEPKIHSEKNNQLATNLKIETIPTIFIKNTAIKEPLTLEGWESLLSL